MISNDVIQADIVAACKADTALVTALGKATNIKEAFYAGKIIAYPAARIKINRQVPLPERAHCDHARLSFSIRVFAEGGSSKAASQLAGLVANLFHGNDGGGKFFQGTGWSTFFRSTGLNGPFRTGETLWTAEAVFDGVVYPG